MSVEEEGGDVVRSVFRELFWLQPEDRIVHVSVWRSECGAQAWRQWMGDFYFGPAECEVLALSEGSRLFSTFIKDQLCVFCNSPTTTREWTFALFY